MIRIRLIYGGVLSEIINKQYEDILVEEDTTLDSLINTVLKTNAKLREWIDKVLLLYITVNGKEIPDPRTYRLKEGDEVVVHPPLYEGG